MEKNSRKILNAEDAKVTQKTQKSQKTIHEIIWVIDVFSPTLGVSFALSA
jgi:hypothetical protein